MTKPRHQTARRTHCQSVVAEGLREHRKMTQSQRDRAFFSAQCSTHFSAIDRVTGARRLRIAIENQSQTLTKNAPQS